MKKHFEIISNSYLFDNIPPKDIASMLICLDTKTVNFKKGRTIMMAGDRFEAVGIVLRGQVQIAKEDIAGNRTILATIIPTDVFGEAICCAGLEASPVSVVAAEDSSILFLNFARILRVCSKTCEFHARLIENMLKVIARKNIFLQNRMDIMSNKSVREKVQTYLESFIPMQGTEITIPLNRQQMAEYLCVERSALSHELMRMKKDGLIDYRKNNFKLLKNFLSQAQ